MFDMFDSWILAFAFIEGKIICTFLSFKVLLFWTLFIFYTAFSIPLPQL